MTETKRGRGRPVTTGTPPVRTLRVGPIWDKAKEIADKRGDKMADVVGPHVERGLQDYIDEHQDEV
ncbi:hypothetical protein Rhe02_55820 [Rhizocola hellebori]|uniref:Uncharacterized protein n=1 Tax=Rhizocola hellebori TaxID=1392758 RepID=A0A8J3QBG1_9ACTN|nr:hypothetical protein [Rhizocola hellebori]GIH07515.1 hypothetical protein Rhe02_55820 [Rhizocola hellebori]